MSFKEGRKIRAIKSFKANGLIHFKAPCSGSFQCEISQGTVFTILNEPREGYGGFYVLPENEKEFELKFVPEEDRKNLQYGGFAFVFMKSDLGKKYEFCKKSNKSLN